MRKKTTIHHWSIFVVISPPLLARQIVNKEIEDIFDEVKIFEIPDDYGEFPDTTGYTADNWETMSSDVEDSNLYPYMTKAMDAALEFVNRRYKTADKLGFKSLEKHIHWPKFGGKIFAVTGHVICKSIGH